jgi:hypothetical protein
MNKEFVCQQLSYICSQEYYYNDSTSLFSLYRDILEYKDFLNENISEELYESLNTELECVFIESRFGGDANDYDLVYKDCIDIVKKIIATL